MSPRDTTSYLPIGFILTCVHILCVFFAEKAVADSEVNVYSHRHYDSDKSIYKSFTDKSGIKVNIVKDKASALIKRLSAEGINTSADVLLTSDVVNLYRAKSLGLLQKVHSKELASNIPSNLRDSEGFWFGLTKRARVIMYNKKTVKESELSTIEDLATPKWKGRLLIRSSSNSYNQSLVASLIVAHGQDEAANICNGIVENMARAPKGNDRDQMRGVIAGLADVCVVNTYYLGKLLDTPGQDAEIGKRLGVFFPNQNDRGSHINISGAGITAHAKNRNNALKFIEFLSSEEAQFAFSEGNHEYPVNPKVPASDLLKSWGEFKADELMLEEIGEYNSEAIKAMDRARWK